MNKQCGVCGERDCCGALTATVLSPLLDAKDAEIERLLAEVERLRFVLSGAIDMGDYYHLGAAHVEAVLAGGKENE